VRQSAAWMRTLSKIGQVALGVTFPASVTIGWVLVAIHAGFPLFGPATDEQRAWHRAGLVLCVVGYAAVAISVALAWRRYPFFARTAAAVGGAGFLIQLVDWLD
jgi:hypothetical protein